MSNKFHFDRVIANIEMMKQELPPMLANQAQSFFVSSWHGEGGWEGNPWPEVQRRMPMTLAYKYARPAARTRHILVQSGALRRAVNNSIRAATWTGVELIVSIPYAKFHNDGDGVLPKRQFMGHSVILQRKQIQLIHKEVNRIWEA